MAQNRPLVSFILPCYRDIKHFRSCLQSLLAQTVENWEAIVVDDGSPNGDEIAHLVSDLEDSRFRLVRHPMNRGLAAARNTGARVSQAAWIACVDCDDLLSEIYCERMLEITHRGRRIDCAFPNSVWFDDSIAVLHPAHVPSMREILRHQPLLAGGLFMRTRVWMQMGGFDESDILREGREDWEFYIRLFHRRIVAVHVDEPLYRYRISSSSLNVRCMKHEPAVRRYIYDKHRGKFDAAGERRRFLGTAYERAATAELQSGNRIRACFLTLRAFCYGITSRSLKTLLKSALPDLSRIRRIHTSDPRSAPEQRAEVRMHRDKWADDSGVGE